MSEATQVPSSQSADAIEKWATASTKRRRRSLLYWSAGMIGTGLIVQLITLYWSHPIAFLVFLGAGASLTGLGMILFVWVIVRALGR